VTNGTGRVTNATRARHPEKKPAGYLYEVATER
jgi:hypothetical protein